METSDQNTINMSLQSKRNCKHICKSKCCKCHLEIYISYLFLLLSHITYAFIPLKSKTHLIFFLPSLIQFSPLNAIALAIVSLIPNVILYVYFICNI